MDRTMLPDDFVRATQATMGDELFGRFLAAFDEEPPVSIRLNPAKMPHGAVPRGARRVGWCPQGYYLPGRPQFTFDPLLHAGCYYVQEAASMFVHHIARQLIAGPVSMLDLCAAPGGKSTALLAALPEGSTLVSNEPVRQRYQVLCENLAKWGSGSSIAVNRYPRDFSREGCTFDAILCDVPCSGEGLFRRSAHRDGRDGGAIGEWSLQAVERCWRLQRDIVGEAWQCLRPGGLLIYSTCTYNTKENEENIRWMMQELGAQTVPVATRPEWGITGSLLQGFSEPVYRFIPGTALSEGLFVCVVRKPIALKAPIAPPSAPEGATIAAARPSRPHKTKEAPSGAVGGAGISGAVGGASGALGPTMQEVLSADFARDSYPLAELDYATAIAFLQRQAITLPADTPRGFVVVCFQGHPLGVVKNIGTRANNLYPKEWAIKSTYIPKEYETIFGPA